MTSAYQRYGQVGWAPVYLGLTTFPRGDGIQLSTILNISSSEAKRWWIIVGTLPGFVEWLEECYQARVYFLLYIQSISFSETTIAAPMCLPNLQVLISHSGPCNMLCYWLSLATGQMLKVPFWTLDIAWCQNCQGLQKPVKPQKNGYCDGSLWHQGKSWRFPIQLWTLLDGEPARGFKNLSILKKTATVMVQYSTRVDLEGFLSNSGLCWMVDLPGASKSCHKPQKNGYCDGSVWHQGKSWSVCVQLWDLPDSGSARGLKILTFVQLLDHTINSALDI